MTSTEKPAAKTASKSVSKPAAKPAAKSTAKPTAKSTAKVSPKVLEQPEVVVEEKPEHSKPKAYVLLTGIDDEEFCQRVSDRMAQGYELYGSPSVTYNGTNVIAAQALVYKKGKKRKR